MSIEIMIYGSVIMGLLMRVSGHLIDIRRELEKLNGSEEQG